MTVDGTKRVGKHGRKPESAIAGKKNSDNEEEDDEDMLVLLFLFFIVTFYMSLAVKR